MLSSHICLRSRFAERSNCALGGLFGYAVMDDNGSLIHQDLAVPDAHPGQPTHDL